MSVARFTEDRLRTGRYHFSAAEAERRMGGTPVAVRAAIRRMKHKGWLVEPARGFLLIVPPEYRDLGCLPAEQFVPMLMEFWSEPYYVALLSAAEIHGAAHQRPQVFQVMLQQNHRPVTCGHVRVEFCARRDMAAVPVIECNTARGILRIATPEVTALELVGYYERCGGLDNVATILTELAECLDVKALEIAARRCPLAWVQRLGYLLELVGEGRTAASLEPLVHDAVESPLIRSRPRGKVTRNRRWKLMLNATVEADL